MGLHASVHTINLPDAVTLGGTYRPYDGGGASPVKKGKFSHTRYRALGPELIRVYRQSARR